ncbi:putative short chain dehydrogenase/ reductase [Annulohypoxylon maeteangense]|uniref:putative short chain dehydrogenase/ reductase n=1 Tax=Annulohypoxylon maeteangense TaxID=1927788 RepID=UPI0020080AA6|nr:putative short chain dehydrogenase/ reductase [Annulohypoxylon maeteangense]KAI0888235.1 putative short chain dehydrogenase/ reductase [Annulohypoxylon maeteangense]
MPSIKNQNILVIGGSSGIGFAVAKLASAEGVNVSIASSNATRVSSAVAKLLTSTPGASIKGYTVDVSNDDAESQLEKLFTDVVAATGQALDHIVYTAASLDVRPVSSVSAEYLRNSVQFGYVVPLLIAKLSARFVKQHYTSSLIFTSGRLAELPMKNMTVASGWAAALYGVTRGLALDLAPVRANLVSPGATDTEIFGEGEAREKIVAYMAKSALLGKIGSPEEVAEAYIYLMKDSNNTGSCVSTNGGVLVQPAENMSFD